MKISELVLELERLKNYFGDIQCCIPDEYERSGNSHIEIEAINIIKDKKSPYFIELS
jgi:hypothetical protein